MSELEDIYYGDRPYYLEAEVADDSTDLLWGRHRGVLNCGPFGSIPAATKRARLMVNEHPGITRIRVVVKGQFPHYRDVKGVDPIIRNATVPAQDRGEAPVGEKR